MFSRKLVLRWFNWLASTTVCQLPWCSTCRSRFAKNAIVAGMIVPSGLTSFDNNGRNFGDHCGLSGERAFVTFL
jgi:hypothetical protein